MQPASRIVSGMTHRRSSTSSVSLLMSAVPISTRERLSQATSGGHANSDPGTHRRVAIAESPSSECYPSIVALALIASPMLLLSTDEVDAVDDAEYIGDLDPVQFLPATAGLNSCNVAPASWLLVRNHRPSKWAPHSPNLTSRNSGLSALSSRTTTAVLSAMRRVLGSAASISSRVLPIAIPVEKPMPISPMLLVMASCSAKQQTVAVDELTHGNGGEAQRWRRSAVGNGARRFSRDPDPGSHDLSLIGRVVMAIHSRANHAAEHRGAVERSDYRDRFAPHGIGTVAAEELTLWLFSRLFSAG